MDELIKDVVIRILENNRDLGSLSGDFAKGIILLLLALKTIRSN